MYYNTHLLVITGYLILTIQYNCITSILDEWFSFQSRPTEECTRDHATERVTE